MIFEFQKQRPTSIGIFEIFIDIAFRDRAFVKFVQYLEWTSHLHYTTSILTTVSRPSSICFGREPKPLTKSGTFHMGNLSHSCPYSPRKIIPGHLLGLISNSSPSP